jgi:hypothetical protein
MHRFRRSEHRDLESRLRETRAKPPQALLEELASRIGQSSQRARPAGRQRFVGALAFCIVLAVGMAAFGGVGYAKTSVVAAAKRSSNAVTSIVGENEALPLATSRAREGHGGHGPPWTHQYSKFVLICFPFTIHGHTFQRTIVVPRALVPYLVPPGTLGPCGFD